MGCTTRAASLALLAPRQSEYARNESPKSQIPTRHFSLATSACISDSRGWSVHCETSPVNVGPEAVDGKRETENERLETTFSVGPLITLSDSLIDQGTKREASPCCTFIWAWGNGEGIVFSHQRPSGIMPTRRALSDW